MHLELCRTLEREVVANPRFLLVDEERLEKVTNRREDFAQQLSRQWINKYGTIVFEDLNITKMVHNHNLANTSQMCSSCGQIVKKNLSIRVHNCPFCGLSIDRDLNAALNIARLGIQSLASA